MEKPSSVLRAFLSFRGSDFSNSIVPDASSGGAVQNKQVRLQNQFDRFPFGCFVFITTQKSVCT